MGATKTKTKKRASNPRDGRVKPGKADEPAEFVAGSAQPPKNFDAAAVADKCGLWWRRNGGDQFIVCFGKENWSTLTSSTVKLHIRGKQQFISESVRRDAGESLSEMDRVFLHTIENRCVDGMMSGLAGYADGVHEFPNGERIIVGRAPHPVVAAPGDWPLVRDLIEGRLNLKLDDAVNGIDQSDYFHCWMRSVLRSLVRGKPGSWTQRLVLVLAGPAGCGKGRLQKLVTWLLGGREANPINYLTGAESFNLNMLCSEHLKIEELVNVSKKTEERLKFSEALKAMVANEGVTARLMRTDPTTVYPFWALTLSMNDDIDKMRAFPPLTPDFAEKLLLLKVRKAELPMPTSTEEEKELFNNTLKAQLPAYVHWLLNEYEPRVELVTDSAGKASRYGVRDFQHPSLARDLFDDTPAAELLMLIDAAKFTEQSGKNFGREDAGLRLWELTAPLNRDDNAQRNRKRQAQGLAEVEPSLWEGSAMDLERLMSGQVPGWSSSVAKEAQRLFMHNSCARLLGSLEKDMPEGRVAQHRMTAGRYWRIGRPSLA